MLRLIYSEPCFFVFISREINSGQAFYSGSRRLLCDSVQNGKTADCWLTAVSANWPPMHWDWKLPLLHIFRAPTNFTYATHVAFPLSLVHLKTQMYILFWTPKLIGLSKVNIQKITFYFTTADTRIKNRLAVTINVKKSLKLIHPK